MRHRIFTVSAPCAQFIFCFWVQCPALILKKKCIRLRLFLCHFLIACVCVCEREGTLAHVNSHTSPKASHGRLLGKKGKQEWSEVKLSPKPNAAISY